MKVIPNSVWLELGQRIANIRRAKGISQIHLAEMADISKEHLSNLERGNKLPSAKTVAQIANVLEVSIDVLIGIDSCQTHLEIDSKLQRLIQGYSGIEKEALLKIIQDINGFCKIVNGLCEEPRRPH